MELTDEIRGVRQGLLRAERAIEHSGSCLEALHELERCRETLRCLARQMAEAHLTALLQSYFGAVPHKERLVSDLMEGLRRYQD
jgi:septation ring formation regulator EzrA